MKQGDLLFAAGKEITTVDLGLFAASGVFEVSVKRHLNIIFFSTGDELVSLKNHYKVDKFMTVIDICYRVYWTTENTMLLMVASLLTIKLFLKKHFSKPQKI